MVDDVLVGGALVLQDDGAVVLVQSEGVDPAAVGLAGVMLGSQEADSEQLIQVGLDQVLQGFLERDRFASQFLGFAAGEPV